MFDVLLKQEVVQNNSNVALVSKIGHKDCFL